jgi:hypothetical protein
MLIMANKMGELQCAVIAWASAYSERGMGIIKSKSKTVILQEEYTEN